MKRTVQPALIATALCSLVACSSAAPSTPVASSPQPVYVADLPVRIRGVSEMSYVTLNGDDSVVFQNIVRVPGQFANDVNLPKQGAVLKLTGTVANNELVSQLQMRVWRRDAQGALKQAQVADYTVHADSVIGEVRNETTRQPQRFPAPENTLIFSANVLVLTEQIVRRAAFIGGDSVNVPVYFYGTAGATAIASVKFDASRKSGSITITGVTQQFVMDSLGVIERLSAGRIQTIRIPFRELPIS